MVIHPSGTFDYVATIPAPGSHPDEIQFSGTDRLDRPGPWLIGAQPRFVLRPDQLVIVADERVGAGSWKYTFNAGDAILRGMQPGDRLHVLRTGCGGVGVSLLRGDALILAFGAVTHVPLGALKAESDSRKFEKGTDLGKIARFHIQSHDERRSFDERECGRISGYDCYVERLFRLGIPGTDESVAISIDEPCLGIATMRSAILCVGGHKIVGWDFFGADG